MESGSEKKHDRMVHNKVFEPVSLRDLSKNEKVIDTTWAMKKKSSGQLEEYVGNKIDYIGKDAIRFTQNMLMHSYSNKFELPKRSYNTPVQPGTVLMKPVENGEVLSREAQSILRSGIGKLMYHMQYSQPDIAQAVRDLARHMT